MRDRKYYMYVIGHKCFQNCLVGHLELSAAHCPLAHLSHLFPLLSTWSLLPAVLSCLALPKSQGHLGPLLHLSFLPVSTG